MYDTIPLTKTDAPLKFIFSRSSLLSTSHEGGVMDACLFLFLSLCSTNPRELNYIITTTYLSRSTQVEL